MISPEKTPLVEIKSDLTEKAGVKLLIKREDLNNKLVSGNKLWKLKYNLEEAKALGHKIVLTFGGAFSNHLLATAGAGKLAGFNTIGVVRGEKQDNLNPVLKRVTELGMKLHYVDRSNYRKKMQPHFTQDLERNFRNFYLIPEGGSNHLAVKGCAEFAHTLPDTFDYLCCPCGTGGTIAGLAKGLANNSSCKVIGFPILKNAFFLEKDIYSFLEDSSFQRNWQLIYDYHFGGYAKKNDQLINFIHSFFKDYSIPLDWIYTGKMIFGVFDLIEKSFFDRGSVIIAVHTGGTQTAGVNS